MSDVVKEIDIVDWLNQYVDLYYPNHATTHVWINGRRVDDALREAASLISSLDKEREALIHDLERSQAAAALTETATIRERTVEECVAVVKLHSTTAGRSTRTTLDCIMSEMGELTSIYREMKGKDDEV